MNLFTALCLTCRAWTLCQLPAAKQCGQLHLNGAATVRALLPFMMPLICRRLPNCVQFVIHKIQTNKRTSFTAQGSPTTRITSILGFAPNVVNEFAVCARYSVIAFHRVASNNSHVVVHATFAYKRRNAKQFAVQKLCCCFCDLFHYNVSFLTVMHWIGMPKKRFSVKIACPPAARFNRARHEEKKYEWVKARDLIFKKKRTPHKLLKWTPIA